MESDSVFLMVGIFCGLAIYNSINVDLSFPLAMFRKLLGENPGLDDLQELDPIVGRSLQQLLDYEGPDIADTFCLNFSTMESDSVFLMVGIFCGLAIYNSINVDLSFPLAMFRKLLGENPGLDDLQELDPIVGRSLQQLLDYEGPDIADTFCLNFSLDIDFFGENRRVDLNPERPRRS
ncbi:hypothetical protein AHF37_10622 [Paragonimus kellicotti]|nr:hypothetical protein AHF37_10622 [Paragonimus kellicotti]